MDSSWENLLNTSFRRLLNNGRNYAAFDKKHICAYVQQFRDNGVSEILDPMSGYGTLTRIVDENNAEMRRNSDWACRPSIATYCVEINTPCYLWQFLLLEENRKQIRETLNSLKHKCKNFPDAPKMSEISSEYYTELGLEIITSIYQTILNIAMKNSDDSSAELIALSILIPFSSRISTSTTGDIGHVKKGGAAIYNGYKEDFCSYLNKLEKVIPSLGSDASKHTLILGDSRNFGSHDFKLNHNDGFKCMITSPPYPNRADYENMFATENYLLNYLSQNKLINLRKPEGLPIGTPKVSGRDIHGRIRSEAVNEFIEKIESYNKTEKSANAAKGYYAPFYRNYFLELQTAYDNISKHLASDFEGLVVVRDNFARGNIVPVHNFIEDIWSDLGFVVDLSDHKEVSFVGLKNPYVKGKKMSTHEEYNISIRRGGC